MTAQPPVRAARLLSARILAVVLFAYLLLRTAWLSDDALITLRSALNITHGWGPGFNATESVQAYTHPLWFLMWATAGSLTGEWVLTVFVLSLALSLGAIAIVLWQARGLTAVIVATAALALSNAFIEYTSSGLENPLAFLLLGVTVVLSLRSMGSTSSWWHHLLLGLTVAAVVLTRLDLLLVVLPMLLLVAWSLRRNLRGVGALAAGVVVPLVVWFTWSFTTYGSLLPNTFDAKRNLQIPQLELVVQGLRYLWVSVDKDPVTGVVIAAGVLIVALWGTLLQRAWLLGVLLYLAYVVWIGGDFMVGRFLAVPVYLLVLVGVLVPIPARGERAVSARRAVEAGIAVVAVVVLLFVAQRPPVSVANPNGPRWDFNAAAGIADERGFYIVLSRGLEQWLLSLGQGMAPTVYQPATDINTALPLRDVRAAANEWPVNEGQRLVTPDEVGLGCGQLGGKGIFGGPRIHWIDTCGLTDRFLAQSPYASSQFRWRIGHFDRPAPDGYEAAVAQADPSMVVDPDEAARLAELWSTIRD
jgi:arabinofuranosyltransferase